MRSLALATTSLALLAAALYLALSYRLGRRQVPSQHRRALEMFRTWWAAAAVTAVMTPLMRLAFEAGLMDVSRYQVVRSAQLVVAAVAVWALLCYLIYMYQGSTKLWRPVTVGYSAFAVLLVVLVVTDPPASLTLRHGKLVGVGAGQGWRTWVILVGLLLPQVIAAAAYLSLLRLPLRQTARYRVRLIGATFVVWLGANLVLRGMPLAPWEEVLMSALAVLAPVMVWAAYFPPAPVRRRWGVEALPSA